jgi:diguanylate cyclase (GGDEF)-like protein
VAEHAGLALSNLKLRSDLQQLSIHDPLTGLYNRRYMEEALERELRRAERKKSTVGVIMLDIDHFKAFNDGFGHAAGDDLLRALGSLVHARLRAGDIACRFGGEEFVLILPEASLEATREKAEELRAHVKAMEVRSLDKRLGPVSISLGIAIVPDHGRVREEVLRVADAALYRAKGEGRDRVVVAEGSEEKRR